MVRPLDLEKRGWCPHATYLEDGHVISARKSHVNFIVRALYCVVLYFILQLPQKYGVRVDLDTFFSAFSMFNEDGQRIRVQPWVTGPGYRYHNSNQQSTDIREDQDNAEPIQCALDNDGFKDQEDVRAPMRAAWERYYQHVANHIPYVASRAAPSAEQNNDKLGVGSTLKRHPNGKAQHQGGRPSGWRTF
jgi:hypothetical protein